MDALLTSAGVSNDAIRSALVDLVGKPLEGCRALVVPTGIYPFGGGAEMAARPVRGEAPTPLTEIGWASVGLLELSVLDSIDPAVWGSAVAESDALLIWGGDPLFLAHWMQTSGLAAVLLDLDSTVYVGVSAGSIVAAPVFAETYSGERTAAGEPLSTVELEFAGPAGTYRQPVLTGAGLGLVDFAVIPHYGHPEHLDASPENAERWAALIPGTTYAIDDDSAVCVRDGEIRVVGEGSWRRFEGVERR